MGVRQGQHVELWSGINMSTGLRSEWRRFNKTKWGLRVPEAGSRQCASDPNSGACRCELSEARVMGGGGVRGYLRTAEAVWESKILL